MNRDAAFALTDVLNAPPTLRVAPEVIEGHASGLEPLSGLRREIELEAERHGETETLQHQRGTKRADSEAAGGPGRVVDR